MTKPTITTRTAKGTPLTIAEMDTNLTNLQDASITFKAPGGRYQFNPWGMFESSTEQAKFGTRSAKFSMSSNNITCQFNSNSTYNQSPFDLMMNEFCWEMWIWIDPTNTNERVLLDMRNSNMDECLNVRLNSTNQIVAYKGSNQIAITSTPLTNSQWHHIAIERASYMGTGATLSSGLYIITDGNINGSGWQDSGTMFQSSNVTRLGNDYQQMTAFKGFIDEVRFTRMGVRYLKNNMSMANTFPITPPTSAFLNDYNTYMLLHFEDMSGVTDDYYNGMGIDLNDTITMTAASPILVSVSDSTNTLTFGFDSNSLSIPSNVAVSKATNMNNGVVEFNMEVSDYNNFINSMGGSTFQIQNNTSMMKQFLVEIYGMATTTATGNMELYNDTNQNPEGASMNIVGGFVPNGAWQISVMSNQSTNYKYRVQNSTGAETMSGTMFLRITKLG